MVDTSNKMQIKKCHVCDDFCNEIYLNRGRSLQFECAINDFTVYKENSTLQNVLLLESNHLWAGNNDSRFYMWLHQTTLLC